MTSKDLLFQIKLAMLYKDVTQKDIAEKTGINLRTLQRRFENPSDFTLDELIKISEFLDIKFEFNYATVTIETTSPNLYVSYTNSRQQCEGCYIYERIKKGEPVVTDACSFCGRNPNKITCEATNNDK